MKGRKKDRVVIFDTTLRDGEQSPGASMGQSEKLQVANQLARLKVDIDLGIAITGLDRLNDGAPAMLAGHAFHVERLHRLLLSLVGHTSMLNLATLTGSIGSAATSCYWT